MTCDNEAGIIKSVSPHHMMSVSSGLRIIVSIGNVGDDVIMSLIRGQSHCQLARQSEPFSHEDDIKASHFYTHLKISFLILCGIFLLTHLTLDYIHYCIITPFKKKTFHIKPSLLNFWNEITQSGMFFSRMFLGKIKLICFSTF